MAVEFQMPKLGLTMEAGTIIKWLVDSGTDVDKGAAVLLIETDKVESDVEASGSGRLHITGAAGETYACGDLIGWFLEPGEEPPAVETGAASPDRSSTTAPVATTAPAAVATSRGEDGRLLASPNARRVAAELGVELARVVGTGPGGRIVSEDVVAAPATGGRGATTFARELARELGVDLADVRCEGPDPRIDRADVVRHVREQLTTMSTEQAGPGEVPLLQEPSSTIPMSGMRGRIAERMHTSLQSMAQLTLTMDARMDTVADHRAAAADPKPGFTDYVIAAAASALAEHPIVNSQIADGRLAVLPEINVGMAVAVDGGLVVPVVKRADALTLAELSSETTRLATAARKRLPFGDRRRGRHLLGDGTGDVWRRCLHPGHQPAQHRHSRRGTPARLRALGTGPATADPGPHPQPDLGSPRVRRRPGGRVHRDDPRPAGSVGSTRVSVRLRYSFAGAAGLAPEQRTTLLGGKGAALARMTALGLPVPAGFTLTTEACNRVAAGGWFRDLTRALAEGLDELEDTSGRRFGEGPSPLLVSVRSGAPVSMPGMMDTVLNVGMTDDVALTLGAATGNGWFGWDTARRFVQSYSSIVLGTGDDVLRRVSLDCLGEDEGRSLDANQLAAATQRMRRLLAEAGFEIPTDPLRQVTEAVNAVFRSWTSDRASTYRQVEGIDDDLGTAATVQMMTFGNLGDRSGTGVAFTRDPSTGAPGIVGDFLVGAQGEDVVAGTHQTLPIADLRTLWPDVATQLDEAATLLEHDLTDLADIEFTVEDGHLWLLQVRKGKRSPRAAMRVAIDLAGDPAFDFGRDDALERVADVLADPPRGSNPDVRAHTADDVLATGLAASPGRVSGRLRTGIDEAIEAEARGEPVILVRRETSPADIAGMAAAVGLVTTLGGLVSHAAVVARSWGLPAVVGVPGVTVEPTGLTVGDRFVAVGETLTIDGEHGWVLLGEHPSDEVELEEVRILRGWQRAGSGSTAAAVDGSTGATEAATVESCSRVMALKGMATADAVAEVLGCSTDDVSSVVTDLVADDKAQELAGARFRLLPDAIAEVDARFATDAERLGPVIEPLLDDFHAANDRFKQVITSWQMRDVDRETVPNDHSDPEYDAAVLARLDTEIHQAIVPIIETVAASEPRFARYADRLEAALAAIAAGTHQMVAHPLEDSYHTVWFELHEELIRLTGRNRADEAAAGRG